MKVLTSISEGFTHYLATMGGNIESLEHYNMTFNSHSDKCEKKPCFAVWLANVCKNADLFSGCTPRENFCIGIIELVYVYTIWFFAKLKIWKLGTLKSLQATKLKSLSITEM